MNATMPKERPVAKKKVTFVHNQYNSPLELYSADEVAQTLRRHASLLSNGAVGWVWISWKQYISILNLSQYSTITTKTSFER